MDDKSQEVFEAALSLPEDQRASLVEALLQTLPSGGRIKESGTDSVLVS